MNMNIEEINAKIQKLRGEQSGIHPVSATPDMQRFFTLDDEINELLKLRRKLSTSKQVPTQEQVDLMDYVLSDEYDDD